MSDTRQPGENQWAYEVRLEEQRISAESAVIAAARPLIESNWAETQSFHDEPCALVPMDRLQALIAALGPA